MATPALPIDVVPNREPMIFRWKYAVNSLAGAAMQNLEGQLPPSVEGAVANLIALTKQLQKENKELWERVEALKPAEGVLIPKSGVPAPPPPAPAKSGKGR